MIRVIFNRKGGVGKSTITCNLAAAAAFRGKSILIVDLDSQGNTTSYLGHDNQDEVVGIAEFFESTIGFSEYRNFQPDDFVRKTEFAGLDLISASAALGDLEQKLASRHKIYKLREFLGKLSAHYDEIYLDTPPALNFYSLSALIAADRCLIPFDCDAFSRDALFGLIEALEEIREDHNDSLSIEGIVINQFIARAKLPQQAVAELAQTELPILQPYLSSSVKIRESHQRTKPMVYLEPKHKLAQQFLALYDGISAT